jgi:hypothetical protein
MANKKWIQEAVQHKGGLHESLGIPADETIPTDKIAEASKKKGKVGRQARLAQILSKFRS